MTPPENRTPPDVNIAVIRQLQEVIAPHVFTSRAVYDGGKNMFTAFELPFEDGTATVRISIDLRMHATTYPHFYLNITSSTSSDRSRRLRRKTRCRVNTGLTKSESKKYPLSTLSEYSSYLILSFTHQTMSQSSVSFLGWQDHVRLGRQMYRKCMFMLRSANYAVRDVSSPE